jgi:hypothetical protein
VVLDAADLIVWLDLPTRIWLPRLIARTYRRVSGAEQLWNGNTETWRRAFWGWDSLFVYAARAQHRRRRDLPRTLANRPHARLRSQADVERFLFTF